MDGVAAGVGVGMLSEAAGEALAAGSVEAASAQWAPVAQQGATELADNGEAYVDTEVEGVGEEGEEEEGDEWGDAGELHDEEMRLAIFGITGYVIQYKYITCILIASTVHTFLT